MTSRAVVAGVLTVILVLVLGAAANRPLRRIPVGPADSERERWRAESRRVRRGRRAALVLGGAFLAGVGTAAIGPFPVVLASGALVALRRHRRRQAIERRRRAVEAAMPDAVELLVLCIHAGYSPTQAVVAVAARAPPAVRHVFADVELGLHRGRPLVAALAALTTAGPLGREVASTVAAADRDGTALAPALDRLAADARAARRRLAEADARRLPVRLTFPLVTCTLPAFALLAIAPAVLGALSTLRANAP